MKNKSKVSYGIGAVLFLSSLVSARFATAESLYENSNSPILAALESAHTQIDIEVYEMDDPRVDQEIRSALQRGVKVRIVHEEAPVGASCHVFTSASDEDSASCQEQKKLVHYVKTHGGEYLPFSMQLCGKLGSKCYEHGKIVMIDHATALISTGNFNSTNLCNVSEHPKNCDRDFTIQTQDRSVLKTLESIFEKDRLGETYSVASVLKKTENERLTVSPESMKPIVDFIHSAKHTLHIETQYLKDPTMNQAILDVARRGVKVSVMVSSACAFAKPTENESGKWEETYGAFDAAGIKTRIFTRQIKIKNLPGYLHAKAIVVDGNRAWVGSVNGSSLALSDNREFGLFFSDSEMISGLVEWMNSDFTNSKSETWKQSLVCAHDRS